MKQRLSFHQTDLNALKTLLVVLYNPIVVAKEKNKKELAERQKKTYETLYKLDAKAAQDLKAQFTSN